jgi:uncharacterized zinc-type alcohol dehydrogenase-like protein
MGAEVTLLSQSLKKQEDGLRLGADHYSATSAPDTFEHLAGRFDLIINTVSAHIDVDAYLGLLAVDGTLVKVGAPAEPLSLDVFSLITGRRSYAGSMIGGIAETQEMLDFCAQHGIASEIELISASRSTTRTNASSRPTSATGSSSTRPHCAEPRLVAGHRGSRITTGISRSVLRW